MYKFRPDLSVVVAAYDMAREIPRTLRSLSPSYQRDLGSVKLEVVVVDNGSPDPLPATVADGFDGSFRLLRIDNASPSPASAVNRGVRDTRGRFVGVIVDGARMVTPGVLGLGLQALQANPRAVVMCMAWHLGTEHQSVSIAKGYNAAAEDELLAAIEWPVDGYRLFEVAALAGANLNSFFGGVNEACFLMVARRLWDEIGGMDERFDLPGGGLANLDLFTRLVELPGTQLVVLIGEGSFHQVHGGASTRPQADQTAWYEQYEQLRGRPYAPPEIRPVYYGTMPWPARRWLRREP